MHNELSRMSKIITSDRSSSSGNADWQPWFTFAFGIERHAITSRAGRTGRRSDTHVWSSCHEAETKWRSGIYWEETLYCTRKWYRLTFSCSIIESHKRMIPLFQYCMPWQRVNVLVTGINLQDIFLLLDGKLCSYIIIIEIREENIEFLLIAWCYLTQPNGAILKLHWSCGYTDRAGLDMCHMCPRTGRRFSWGAKTWLTQWSIDGCHPHFSLQKVKIPHVLTSSWTLGIDPSLVFKVPLSLEKSDVFWRKSRRRGEQKESAKQQGQGRRGSCCLPLKNNFICFRAGSLQHQHDTEVLIASCKSN